MFNEDLKDMDLPGKWILIPLKDLTEAINPGFPSGKHNQLKIGVPHLRPMNISPQGTIDLSVLKYVEVDDFDALQRLCNSISVISLVSIGSTGMVVCG